MAQFGTSSTRLLEDELIVRANLTTSSESYDEYSRPNATAQYSTYINTGTSPSTQESSVADHQTTDAPKRAWYRYGYRRKRSINEYSKEQSSLKTYTESEVVSFQHSSLISEKVKSEMKFIKAETNSGFYTPPLQADQSSSSANPVLATNTSNYSNYSTLMEVALKKIYPKSSKALKLKFKKYIVAKRRKKNTIQHKLKTDAFHKVESPAFLVGNCRLSVAMA